MNISAIASPSPLAPVAAAPDANKPAGKEFDQVLSAEVAQRAAPKPQASRQTAPAKPAAQPANEKPKQAEDSQAKPAADTIPVDQATVAEIKDERTEDAADIPGTADAIALMDLMTLTPATPPVPAVAPQAAVGVDGEIKDAPAAGQATTPAAMSLPDLLADKLAAPSDIKPAPASLDAPATPAGTVVAREADQSAPLEFNRLLDQMTAMPAQARAVVADKPMAALSDLQQATAPAPMAPMHAAAQLPQPIAPTDKISPPVGSPAWDQALGQKVIWMVQGGEQSASLTMNPPDLGPLKVVISVHNDQATVNFTAAQPEVRGALENALPRLREMMNESGIQLGQANVGTGNQQQQADSGRRPSRYSANTEPDAPRAQTGIVRIARNGVVDTFA